MLTSIRGTTTARRAASLPLQPPEPKAVLLDSLDAVEDEESILVIGKDGLDLMCALLSAGAPQVTHLCSHERPESDSASLAIVPDVPSLDWLAHALPCIRRALHANGRLVLSIGASTAAPQTVRRMLSQHGFGAIRARQHAGLLLLRAEQPAFGLRRCA